MLMKNFAIAVGFALVLCFAAASRAIACTPEQVQILINAGQYADAVTEFTCVVNGQPTDVEGYRGRIEVEVLLGRYSDAVRDEQRIVAFVTPVHPDAENTILAEYSDRLAATPDDIATLTGASFSRWWFFQYASAIHLLNQIIALEPNNSYANLFRG